MIEFHGKDYITSVKKLRIRDLSKAEEDRNSRALEENPSCPYKKNSLNHHHVLSSVISLLVQFPYPRVPV